MPTTIVVGDLHLKATRVLPALDRLIDSEKADRVVFLGDYLDDWDATPEDFERECRALAEWADGRRKQGLDLVFLLGNHDLEYLRGAQGPGTWVELTPYCRKFLHRLNVHVAVEDHGWLLTHAGVTRAWARRQLYCAQGTQNPSAAEVADELNWMLSGNETNLLAMAGPGRGGSQLPSPLWADLDELLADPLPGVRQIVGHTPVDTCGTVNGAKEPDIIFCDTMSTSPDGEPYGDGTVLVIDEDGTTRKAELTR
ncbi:metallophosphoesterase [Olsenella sp. YH-ols2217]|uniref:Metallophosphoesterase n=1 Tax=Kribbibacterium absianum TaxID=3044210 RepID=A0ABT6ZLW0_9ACTN|nr:MULTISPECIES: metallophosphoesterase [unclassified Olsenella]MDJ1121844.1 metallophosphoesterase [Olsenella sp. YH-ols2216]MDJ1129852.1 metallophosphoesterase [Olsenella sp. YH-ols2217]